MRWSLLAVFLLAACSQPAAPPPADNSAALRAQLATAERQIEDLRGRVVDLQKLAQATAPAVANESLEQVRGERDAALAEAAQYRAGLERAVGELNTMRAKLGLAQVSAAYASVQPVSAPRRADARVSVYSSPNVQFTGAGVIVSGRLWNSGEGEARGTVEIQLLRDGQVIGQQYQDLFIPARNEISVSATFPAQSGQGTYSGMFVPSY